MTTTPDPETAREIARDLILNHAKNLAQDDVTVFESVIEKNVCVPLSVGEQEALSDDVLVEIGRAQIAVSWPDEQPQDERDGDEVFAGTVVYGPLDDSTRNLIAAITSHVATNEVSAALPNDEDERDGDVRAVAEVVTASGATWVAVEAAINRLRARFADRIAALDARDAKGGE